MKAAYLPHPPDKSKKIELKFLGVSKGLKMKKGATNISMPPLVLNS
jgi:hypothetical protein